MSPDLDLLTSARSSRQPQRLRRSAAALAVAALAALGACSQDTSEGGGVEPSDQEPLPAQQPEGGDDPTLSGEDTSGVGDGQDGGSGSGAPDSGNLEGETGDSSTAGENG